VTAAVVQGNVPRTGMDAFAQREAVLLNHVQASEQLAADIAVGKAPQPQLVVWPENSSDLDPYTDAEAYDQISKAVTALGVPTLVGLVVTAPDGQGLQNTGVVWDPQAGPGQTYVKRHPVPFGEYVPFRSLLSPFVSRFDRVPRDFVAGDVPGVLQVGPATVGDVICFEVAYDSVVRDVVRSGADVIAVQTNNATYGRTGQVEQQLAMARLRAVEHGRSVLVAATSGISAVIAPDGQVLAQAPEFTQDALVVRVPLRTGLTLADRLGAVPEWLLALVGLAAVVAAVVLGRGTGTPDVEDDVPAAPASAAAGRSTNTSADA
jgi:apolipoprotein N-acyltransferase